MNLKLNITIIIIIFGRNCNIQIKKIVDNFFQNDIIEMCTLTHNRNGRKPEKSRLRLEFGTQDACAMSDFTWNRCVFGFVCVCTSMSMCMKAGSYRGNGFTLSASEKCFCTNAEYAGESRNCSWCKYFIAHLRTSTRSGLSVTFFSRSHSAQHASLKRNERRRRNNSDDDDDVVVDGEKNSCYESH